MFPGFSLSPGSRPGQTTPSCVPKHRGSTGPAPTQSPMVAWGLHDYSLENSQWQLYKSVGDAQHNLQPNYIWLLCVWLRVRHIQSTVRTYWQLEREPNVWISMWIDNVLFTVWYSITLCAIYCVIQMMDDEIDLFHQFYIYIFFFFFTN